MKKVLKDGSVLDASGICVKLQHTDSENSKDAPFLL